MYEQTTKVVNSTDGAGAPVHGSYAASAVGSDGSGVQLYGQSHNGGEDRLEAFQHLQLLRAPRHQPSHAAGPPAMTATRRSRTTANLSTGASTYPFFPMNPFLAAGATLAILTASAPAPAPAQTRNTLPSISQVSDSCDVTTKNLQPFDGKAISETDTRCFGVSIVDGHNRLTIHFKSGNPGLPGGAIATFVIAPGFKNGLLLPVSHVVFFMGSKRELVVQPSSGSCNAESAKAVEFHLVRCSAILPSALDTNGREYKALVVGKASFSAPISAEILRPFQP